MLERLPEYNSQKRNAFMLGWVCGLILTLIAMLTHPLNKKEIVYQVPPNPISLEQYQAAKMKQMQGEIKCLSDRLEDRERGLNLEKVFPCIATPDANAVVGRYEMWEILHEQ